MTLHALSIIAALSGTFLTSISIALPLLYQSFMPTVMAGHVSVCTILENALALGFPMARDVSDFGTLSAN
jgi:hypothetical protein